MSRNYRHKYDNKLRDFSYVFDEILTRLDRESCDTVLFSLYTLQDIPSLSQMEKMRLKNIRAVLIEEFRDGRKRIPVRFIVYYKKDGRWLEYSFKQCFGRRRDFDDIEKFVSDELPKRIIGNACVLLCGEINGVKYLDKTNWVEDDYKLRSSIPETVQIVLNPAHDLMTRHEMEKKRRFLSMLDESKPGRLIVSVWNKGKQFKNHKTGKRTSRKETTAWLAFRDGTPVDVVRVDAGNLHVEMRIVNAA